MIEKYKVGIRFDKGFLKSIKDDSNSGVEVKRSRYHFSLHPVQLNNFDKSIKQILNTDIAKFSKNLNGILLGYQKMKLISSKGYIHDDSCFIHLDIEADFFVFTPEIGKELKGVVNRKSKDHVGVLVYNALNVSILKPRDEGAWAGDLIEIGYEVLFKITYINMGSFMPHIRGQLVSVLSEVKDLHTNNNDSPMGVQPENKAKKRKHSELVESSPQKKKRKKLESMENSNEVHCSGTEDTLAPEKKKKKKQNGSTSSIDTTQGGSSISIKSEQRKKTNKHSLSFEKADSMCHTAESSIEGTAKKRKKLKEHNDTV